MDYEASEIGTIVTRPIGRERRTNQRNYATHPVKVYDERADKYFAGRASNTSPDGALLVLQRAMPIASGDNLSIAIARTADDVVFGEDDLIPSEVLRVTPIDAFTQAVAVRFMEVAGIGEMLVGAGNVPHAA